MQCRGGQKRASDFPGNGVKDCSQLPCGCWGLNPGPSVRAVGALNPRPSLQSQKSFILNLYVAHVIQKLLELQKHLNAFEKETVEQKTENVESQHRKAHAKKM